MRGGVPLAGFRVSRVVLSAQQATRLRSNAKIPLLAAIALVFAAGNPVQALMPEPTLAVTLDACTDVLNDEVVVELHWIGNAKVDLIQVRALDPDATFASISIRLPKNEQRTTGQFSTILTNQNPTTASASDVNFVEATLTGSRSKNATTQAVATITSVPECSVCVVPNLVGLSLAAAEALWTAAGFTGAMTPTGDASWIVTTQSSAPGNTAACSDGIAIQLAPPPPG